MDQDNGVKAYGAAMLFSIMIAFSFLGIKLCVGVASPLLLLTHRYNWAFLCLVVLLLTKRMKWTVKGWPGKNLYLTAGFYIGFMVVQTWGLMYSTSIESSILFAVVPIIAKVLAGVILKETSTWKQNAFMGLSVAALVLMIVMGATAITTNLFGIVLLFISSVMMATSNVYMRYLRNEYRPSEITAMISAGGFVVFNVAAIVYGLATGTLGTYFEPLKEPTFLLGTAYLGIFCILISSQLIAYMLANMEAVKATIFGNFSTALSILVGVIWLSEPLLPYHIICTILIIAGVLGVSFTGSKASKIVQSSGKEELK